MCNLWSLKKFTSAYLFQIAREKSFDYLLIIYVKKFLHADWWKNFEMVEQKERTQSGKNCAIQGVQIWLAICEFLFRDFPVNQFNFKFLHSVSTFCTNFVFLHSKNFKFRVGSISAYGPDTERIKVHCFFKKTIETVPVFVGSVPFLLCRVNAPLAM